jgi:hypothetical protein
MSEIDLDPANQQTVLAPQGRASQRTVGVSPEGAKLVTLQTRQALALRSLSSATQPEQAILRLFR